MNSEKPFLSPTRTVITSFTPRTTTAIRRAATEQSVVSSPYEEGDWVLCLTTDTDHKNDHQRQESLSCASSNGQVKVYDAQRLHLVNSFQHASPAVTDLIYGPQHHHSLLSAGREGTVLLYDLRQQQQQKQHQEQSSFTTSRTALGGGAQARIQLPMHQPALCLALGYDGYLCAIGSSKGRIHFFDLRNPQQLLGSYMNSHRDDVTQVRFSTAGDNQHQLLLSGSDDGLICLFDITQPTEEAALLSILNVGAPVRKVGFCGSGHRTTDRRVVYCLTGNETLSLWNAADQTTTLLQQFTRDHFLLAASATAATTSTFPILQQQDPRWTSPPQAQPPSLLWNSMDYLVDAHWDARHQQLQILTGGSLSSQYPSSSCSGNSALFRIKASNHANPTVELEHMESMLRGHCGVIRAWCPLWYDDAQPSSSTSCPSKFIITAGEDARLCEWKVQRDSIHSQTNNPASVAPAPFGAPEMKRTGSVSSPPTGSSGGGGGGGPVRRPRQRHKPSSGMFPY